MKTIQALIAVVLIGGLAVSAAWADPPANPAAPTTQPDPAGLTAAIESIRQSADPSAVVAAYAQSFGDWHGDVRLHEAYIGRMVELGAPELAYRQARLVSGLDPKAGLAWGVVAHVEARRGQMADAISAILRAAKLAPEDRFVQRAAGGIVAWYESTADKPALAEATKNAFEQLRRTLGFKQDFVDSYWAARNAYENRGLAEAQNPAAAPSQPRQAQPPQQADTAGTSDYNPPPYVPRLYQPPTQVPNPYPLNWMAARHYGYTTPWPYYGYELPPAAYPYDYYSGPYYYRNPLIIIRPGGTPGSSGRLGYRPAPGFTSNMERTHPAPYIDNRQVRRAK